MTVAVGSIVLREKVVLKVVRTISFLTMLLYGSAIALISYGKAVPGELWLAAGQSSGALIALLINTKSAEPSDVNVINGPQDPVPVEPGDMGHSDINLILLVGIFIGVLLLLFGVHFNSK